MNGLNQTLHVRNGSAGTSCRLSTFLGSIRCCKMSTFTLSRCGEAAVAGLVHHETSKVARRVSCGRPEAWHASRFSAHIASAPLCNLDPEMGSAPGAPYIRHVFGLQSWTSRRFRTLFLSTHGSACENGQEGSGGGGWLARAGPCSRLNRL